MLSISSLACADTWLVFILLQASSCIDQPVDPDLGADISADIPAVGTDISADIPIAHHT